MTVRVFIGLGSNLSDPKKQLQLATQALGQMPATELIKVSSIYMTRPMGSPDQGDYFNAVIELETDLDATALLDNCQTIENNMGRKREGERWQARIIDIDILLYGDENIHTPDLIVPHPGMHKRAFVLYPLQELDAQVSIPGKEDIAVLLQQDLEGKVLQRLEEKICP